MTATPYPPATRKLRLGFVGGGRGALVSSWHRTGARLSGRWEIVAGALSSDPEVAKASGADWGLAPDRSYTDFKEMAEKEAARTDGIDAVCIVTPNNMHAAPAMAFMDAGIDIICDKPLCNLQSEAEALIARHQKTDLVFAVTHPYIYHPMVVQMREMIKDGAIGELRQLHVEYVQDGATEAGNDSKGAVWRRDPAVVGRTSTVGDIGTHAHHLAEFVTGLDITALRAEFHVCGAEKTMEDTAMMNLKFENGAPGTLWATQAAPGNYCGLRLRLYGQKAGLHWDQEYPEHLRYTPLNAPEQILVRGHGAGMHPAAERMITLPRGHGESLSDAWGNLYTEIAVAVDARRSGQTLAKDALNLPGIEDGARGVRFVDAAADSHEAGGTWQDI